MCATPNINAKEEEEEEFSWSENIKFSKKCWNFKICSLALVSFMCLLFHISSCSFFGTYIGTKMWMMMETNIFPRSLTQKNKRICEHLSQCVACQPIKCSNSLTNKIQWDLALYWKIGPYVMLVCIRIFIREFRTIPFSVFLSWFDFTFLDSIYSYDSQANTTNNKIPT